MRCGGWRSPGRLVGLSILYLRCCRRQIPAPRRRQRLSILYLRCWLRDWGFIYRNFVEAFNSLFEMHHTAFTTVSTSSAELSILYLRCVDAQRRLYVLSHKRLSILYLRCSGVSAVHVKTCKTFNSLFEMRTLRPCLCAERAERALTFNSLFEMRPLPPCSPCPSWRLSFQFSI